MVSEDYALMMMMITNYNLSVMP